MSFSDFFSNYMNENDFSIPRLSKIIKIDRATLYRYANGERTPKTRDVVDSLATALCMSVDEREKFLEEYDKTILGENVVNSYLYMKNLLNDLINAKDFFNPEHDSINEGSLAEITCDENTVVLSSPHAVVSYVMRMFRNCVKSEGLNKKVMLVMQPSYSDIQGMLMPIFYNTDVEIEQIVCLEKSSDRCYINLDIIKDILPQCLNLQKYKVYYHYDSLSCHINSASIFPNLIIAGDCALMFDYEMQIGFFTKEKAIVEVLEKQFVQLCGKCYTLLENGAYLESVEGMNADIAGTDVGVIFNQPCVAPCLSRELLETCIYENPGKASLIDALEYQYGDWDGIEHKGGTSDDVKIESYCTRSGLLEIMENGYVEEFPSQLQMPLKQNYRVDIVQRMIYLMKHSRLEYVFIKNDFELPSNIQVYWNNGNGVVAFRYVNSAKLMQISIKEASIFNTIFNFRDYLHEKDFVYTREETLKWLEDLYKKMSEEKPSI